MPVQQSVQQLKITAQNLIDQHELGVDLDAWLARPAYFNTEDRLVWLIAAIQRDPAAFDDLYADRINTAIKNLPSFRREVQ